MHLKLIKFKCVDNCFCCHDTGRESGNRLLGIAFRCGAGVDTDRESNKLDVHEIPRRSCRIILKDV
jgi:hypothetical protein